MNETIQALHEQRVAGARVFNEALNCLQDLFNNVNASPRAFNNNALRGTHVALGDLPHLYDREGIA